MEKFFVYIFVLGVVLSSPDSVHKISDMIISNVLYDEIIRADALHDTYHYFGIPHHLFHHYTSACKSNNKFLLDIKNFCSKFSNVTIKLDFDKNKTAIELVNPPLSLNKKCLKAISSNYLKSYKCELPEYCNPVLEINATILEWYSNYIVVCIGTGSNYGFKDGGLTEMEVSTNVLRNFKLLNNSKEITDTTFVLFNDDQLKKITEIKIKNFNKLIGKSFIYTKWLRYFEVINNFVSLNGSFYSVKQRWNKLCVGEIKNTKFYIDFIETLPNLFVIRNQLPLFYFISDLFDNAFIEYFVCDGLDLKEPVLVGKFNNTLKFNRYTCDLIYIGDNMYICAQSILPKYRSLTNCPLIYLPVNMSTHPDEIFDYYCVNIINSSFSAFHWLFSLIDSLATILIDILKDLLFELLKLIDDLLEKILQESDELSRLLDKIFKVLLLIIQKFFRAIFVLLKDIFKSIDQENFTRLIYEIEATYYFTEFLFLFVILSVYIGKFNTLLVFVPIVFIFGIHRKYFSFVIMLYDVIYNITHINSTISEYNILKLKFEDEL